MYAGDGQFYVLFNSISIIHCMYVSMYKDGWITCNFTSFSTVFQLYQDNGCETTKSCVQCGPFTNEVLEKERYICKISFICTYAYMHMCFCIYATLTTCTVQFATEYINMIFENSQGSILAYLNTINMPKITVVY